MLIIYPHIYTISPYSDLEEHAKVKILTLEPVEIYKEQDPVILSIWKSTWSNHGSSFMQ